MQYITKCMWLTGNQYDCNKICTHIKSCTGVNVMSNLTSKELNDLLNYCSSVHKIIQTPYRKVYVWKKRAILTSDGNLVSLEEYLRQSGLRVPRVPVQIERNTKLEIKQAIAEYSTFMEHKFGPNWRSEKKRAVVKLFSLSQLSILLK